MVKKNILKVTVVEDLLIVIWKLQQESNKKKGELHPLIICIHSLVCKIRQIDLYHVLHERNEVVDQMANLGTRLEVGEVHCSNGRCFVLPPP